MILVYEYFQKWLTPPGWIFIDKYMTCSCGNMNVHCYLPESRVILRYVCASMNIMIQFIVLNKLNFFRAFHLVFVSIQTFCIFKFFRTRLMYCCTHVSRAFPFWYDRYKEWIQGTQLCAINPFWQNHPFYGI
jgi:hypothetical protein